MPDTPPLPAEILNPNTPGPLAKYEPNARAHAERIWSSWWNGPRPPRIWTGVDDETASQWIIAVYTRRLYEQQLNESPLATINGAPALSPLALFVSNLTAQVERLQTRMLRG